VFLVRYLDLFMYFISLYNTTMKLFFIGSTCLIIYLMRIKKPFCSTYDSLGDTFPHLKVLLPAALVLAIIIHAGDTTWEFVWSFSLWLEALAFIPQIIMLNKIRVIENLTSHYVACLGLYRFFYILNW
jgi:ER lumen protein retaining receptor